MNIVLKIWFKYKNNKPIYNELCVNVIDIDIIEFNSSNKLESSFFELIIKKYANLIEDKIISINCFNCFREYDTIIILTDIYVMEHYMRKLKINKLLSI